MRRRIPMLPLLGAGLLFAAGCSLFSTPAAPALDTGPSAGRVDSVCSFRFAAYWGAEIKVAWGDRETTGWFPIEYESRLGRLRPMPPLEGFASALHAWAAPGTYSITSRARDGRRYSAWSDPYTITITAGR